MANFRQLTKQETKLFDCFIKGYCQGLKAVSPVVKEEYEKANKKVTVSIEPSDMDILTFWKDTIPFFTRKTLKNCFGEFRKGFMAGYFRRLSSEDPLPKLYPPNNPDFYEYLKNTWLSEHVYPTKGE